MTHRFQSRRAFPGAVQQAPLVFRECAVSRRSLRLHTVPLSGNEEGVRMNTDAPTADGNRERRGRTGGPRAAGSEPMRRPVLATALLTVGLIASPGAVYAQTPCPERLDTELLEARLDDFAEIADHTVLLEVRNGDDTWSEAIGPRSLEEEA